MKKILFSLMIVAICIFALAVSVSAKTVISESNLDANGDIVGDLLVDLGDDYHIVSVDISYLDKKIQDWLYEYICDNGFIKPNQIAELRKFVGQGNMTQPLMISILNSTIPIKAPAKKVTFTEKKLTKYFPEHYSSADMERVIVSLLERWKEEQGEV